jgi:hypothetical protein
MAMLAPPAPPLPPTGVLTGDNDGPRRLRMRLTQVTASLATLLLAAWVCTLGPIPAIVALMVAKHVLVAVLMMGLGVDAPREERWRVG